MPEENLEEYEVTWKIEIVADSFKNAAKQALGLLRDPESIVTVFDVTNDETGEQREVDLHLCTEKEKP